jgi:hypothetical protein
MRDMKTAEDVCELGLYVSSCRDEELIFAPGDCFSRCPRCERLCEWEVVNKLVSWEDMEEQVAEEEAA